MQIIILKGAMLTIQSPRNVYGKRKYVYCVTYGIFTLGRCEHLA